MFRLFLLLPLLYFALYGCEGGYNACLQKAKDAKIMRQNSLFIPVKNNQRIVYSHEKPKEKILKYDPFLSLYLIKDKKPFFYPYDVNMRLQLGTAIMNDKRVKEGKTLKHQRGLDFFAKYSQKLSTPAIISSSCCSLEAIVGDKGLVEKEYLHYFLATKTVNYADIGIRVHDKNGLVFVEASDPFMKNNPFAVGDYIMEYDKKKVKNAAILMKKILFAPVGSKHLVKIKRGSKFFTHTVRAKKRYGGGYISDTFLEQKGIYFDDTLHIITIKKVSQSYGLKVGDKLIQANGVIVTNQNALRKNIGNFKEYSSLLFERNNFQFFVNIK